MLSIKIDRVNGYDFEGRVHSSQLSPDQLTRLGLPTDLLDDVAVEGTFSVEFDDDIAMPQIESCFVVGEPDGGERDAIVPVYYSSLAHGPRRRPDGTAYGGLVVSGAWTKTPTFHEIELDLDDVDLDDANDQLSQYDNGDWYADRIAAKGDRQYDSWRDNQLE